ncbi:MAG: NAD(P)(+) transhydrogenase (Re/Si-specific) subunit beta [Holosporaceae bacterium]|jgi:NAD(P) transhydrogenase subunit beta|nr:NAD(P)(+) transhydrogenase (Re/Si-specific) subunit beta [Holosporaceae bacterium]
MNILYLIAAICFIFSLKGLSSPETAYYGNVCGIVGMFLAGCAAYLAVDVPFGTSDLWFSLVAIVIGGGVGITIAKSVSMTNLPQMVAGFHSLVGLAAVLVTFATYFAPEIFNIASVDGTIGKCSLLEMGIGAAIGAITFSGSVVAFLKLDGVYGGHNVSSAVNAFLASSVVSLITWFVISESIYALTLFTLFAFMLGFTLIAPVGGADMPVIVSMLNSYSGWATAGIGFTLQNDLLIIIGALVGASGAILSYVMCRGMNRSLCNVMFVSGANRTSKTYNVVSKSSNSYSFRAGAPEDAAFILKNAKSVIIVPGYGMATSQAQHSLKEFGDILKKNGTSVRYAIHPVAGRMPGHMNVLLAEAGIPYEDVFELDEINRDFASCDVAYVVGANDITNPATKNDPSSSIYGMPVLEVEKAKIVLFLKRSIGCGYAGVDNELFYSQNTMMLLGDAKKTTESIIKAL